MDKSKKVFLVKDLNFRRENKPKKEVMTESEKSLDKEEKQIIVYEKEVHYLTRLSLFFINDFIKLIKVNDSKIQQRIEEIKERAGDKRFNLYHLYFSYDIVNDVIKEHGIEKLDDFSESVFKELQREIFNFFELEEQKSLYCRFFGHKYIEDEMSRFNFGKRRCLHCGKWEEESTIKNLT